MQRICRICSSSPPADMQHHLLQTLILHGHTKYRLMTSFRCHSHNDISKAAFVSRYSRVLWPKIGTLKEWEHFLDLSLIFGLMRIAAMTNICDWIKEFSSYIKLGVSGAGNKYSVWLQFEWLQCCSALSPGSWSYLRCRELQWQRPGKGTISHDPPDTGGIIIIIWCHTVWWPGSDQCCMSQCLGCLELAEAGPGLEDHGLTSTLPLVAVRGWGSASRQGGLSPIGWWGRPWLWPDSSLRSVSQTCSQDARWQVCPNKKGKSTY